MPTRKGDPAYGACRAGAGVCVAAVIIDPGVDPTIATGWALAHVLVGEHLGVLQRAAAVARDAGILLCALGEGPNSSHVRRDVRRRAVFLHLCVAVLSHILQW